MFVDYITNDLFTETYLQTKFPFWQVGRLVKHIRYYMLSSAGYHSLTKKNINESTYLTREVTATMGSLRLLTPNYNQ